MQADHWIKCISTEGHLRGVAIQAGSLVRWVNELHGLTGEPARALGEALVAAWLVASYCKAGERINLNVQGLRQALVDAYPDGAVRGYLIDRQVSPQPKTDTPMGPWGSGFLSVLRTKGQEGAAPYIGTVPLVTGHLAKDLSFYWLQSEQVPSAVGIAINLDAEGKVQQAGGFLVQAMPGAQASDIHEMEKHISDIQSLAARLEHDADPVHLLSQIFQSTAFVLVEEKPLRFECNCSQKRVERALALMGAPELQSIIDEEGHAVVRCDFCTRQYVLSKEELERMVGKVKK